MPRISSIADMSVIKWTGRATLHYATARVVGGYRNFQLAGREFFLERLDISDDFLRDYRIELLPLFVKQLGTGAALTIKTVESERTAECPSLTLLRRSSIHVCPFLHDIG